MDLHIDTAPWPFDQLDYKESLNFDDIVHLLITASRRTNEVLCCECDTENALRQMKKALRREDMGGS